jgi:hypothetical protein
MSHIQKPAFEQYRQEITQAGRPLLEKNVQPIQAAIIRYLDGIEGLLIEKSRRLPHNDGMIEISAKWLGLNASQQDVVRRLKAEWPESELGANESRFTVAPSDEAVLLMFAATYDEGRFLTGRMLITF